MCILNISIYPFNFSSSKFCFSSYFLTILANLYLFKFFVILFKLLLSKIEILSHFSLDNSPIISSKTYSHIPGSILQHNSVIFFINSFKLSLVPSFLFFQFFISYNRKCFFNLYFSVFHIYLCIFYFN